MLHPTQHTSVNVLLRDLVDRLERLFGGGLVGVYLYGSSVAGDFDEGHSDVDLVVACSAAVEGHLPSIHALHRDLALARPQWEDRIDAIYVPASALRTFQARTSPIAVVSPGEPLHLTDTHQHRMNWYLVQETGVTLLGPPPGTLIAPTTQDEFVATVRAHLCAWPAWITESDRPGFHAYAVLTTCRALHACRHGTQVSKRKAALWAAGEYPEWKSVVEKAYARRGIPVHSIEELRAAQFIDFAVQQAGRKPCTSPSSNDPALDS